MTNKSKESNDIRTLGLLTFKTQQYGTKEYEALTNTDLIARNI